MKEIIIIFLLLIIMIYTMLPEGYHSDLRDVKNLLSGINEKLCEINYELKKLNKKGTYNGTVKFAGNAYYKASSKSVKITVK